MDELWKHHAEWKKLNIKSHMVWFYLYELSRIEKCVKIEILVIARGWENSDV